MRKLRHSTDSEPGYTRIRRGKGFSYHDEKGDRIADDEVIERLNSLAVPPAYKDVWFCKDDNGHVQATGVDEKGRKQYCYHDAFREAAEEKKFERLADFGRALPKIRRGVEQALGRRKLTRETVLAAVIRLIDRERLRVGNEQYARANKSFGVTTLRNHHVERLKTRFKFSYKGKHGIEQDVTIAEPALVRILRDCHDLPGQQLFQYSNGDGEPCSIDSADVNEYLRELSGEDFTAKTFRTWGGSAMAMDLIVQAARKEEPITLKSIVEPVAESLRNTPAVTRSSYIHPKLIEAIQDRPLDPFAGADLPSRARARLSLAETRLLAYIDPAD